MAETVIFDAILHLLTSLAGQFVDNGSVRLALPGGQGGTIGLL